MDIHGKTVVITGASSGIGAATAKAMASCGARLALLARNQEALQNIASKICAIGRKARPYPVDLSNAEAVAKVARTITADLGVPDILVNNAGAGCFRFIEETSPEEAVAMMAAPYFAAFNVTRTFLPDMMKRGTGCIANITSPASRIVWPGATAYTAARWAMRGFTKALRADLAHTNISVSLIVPPKVSSGYWEHNPGSEERLPKIAKILPTISPERAAQGILAAIEKEAREYVFPLRLKLVYGLDAVSPRLVEWLVKVTGYRRQV